MPLLTFHLIPHTHWDREWYLLRAELQVRLVDMMDDLVKRLREEPGYRSFLLDGQTVLVEDYLRVRPEREAEVRELVRSGHLSVGPWYVLPDEQIPAGESLVRNLLLGTADATRLGGRLGVLYSPDAFGHPACWPDLAHGFGLRFGVVWRGIATLERDWFKWTTESGSEVLVWHLPPAGYEIGAALPGDAQTLPEAWRWVRGLLVERAATSHIPVFVGADHHAAHPELPRLRGLLADLERPNTVRVSRLDEFFAAAAGEAVRAPQLRGEQRQSNGTTWVLQGVHGTRAPLKRRNGACELWLERWAEPLVALARWYGRGDRRPALERAWRALLQCHFHDTIAGSTSDAVTREAETRLDGVMASARELTRAAAADLVKYDPDAAREQREVQAPRLVLWNPAPRPRGGVVVADLSFFRRDVPIGPPGASTVRTGPGMKSFSLRTEDGRAIPYQILDRRHGLERLDAARHYPDQDEVDWVRVALRAPSITGMGFALLAADRPAVAPAGTEIVEVRGRSLVNRTTVVTLEPTGALSLFDRRTKERWLDLLRLESDGDAGDTYSFCPIKGDRLLRSQGPVRVRRLAAGPLVAALEARWSLRNRAAVRLVVMLHADSPVARCILDIDNQAPNHRLRARFPLGVKGGVSAGTAFGSVVRDAVGAEPSGSTFETPVRTAPAHRFIAAADGDRGLAVLAPGFFEYETTRSGDVLVTLLRSIGELSRADLPTRPGHAAWPTPTPAAQCLGSTRVELAIGAIRRHDLDRGDVVALLWESVFTPLRGMWLRDAIGVSVPMVGITLEGAGLVHSTLKAPHAGDGLVLRCYNATSRPAAGAFRFAAGVRTAHRSRLDEHDEIPLVLEDGGRTVRFTAAPREIVTIRVN